LACVQSHEAPRRFHDTGRGSLGAIQYCIEPGPAPAEFPFEPVYSGLISRGKPPPMTIRLATAAILLALTGCGVPEYFDQHPANVRPEPEAVAAALHLSQNVQASNVPAAANPAGAEPLSPPAPQLAAPGVAASRIRSPDRLSAPPPATAPLPIAPAPAEIAASRASREIPPSSTLAPAEPLARTVESPAPRVEAVSQPAVAPNIGVPPPTLPGGALSSTSGPEPSRQEVREMSVSGAAQIETESSPAPSAMPTTARNAHCQSVANTRADDVAAAGQDREIQRVVREGTYANCVAWQAAHAGHD